MPCTEYVCVKPAVDGGQMGAFLGVFVCVWACGHVYVSRTPRPVAMRRNDKKRKEGWREHV